MANDVVKRDRPPMPDIGRITGLSLGAVRSRMEGLRESHAGLTSDLDTYTMAVEAVRDHVRSLHEDLKFEVSEGGNGTGGQVSQQQVERRIEELSGGGATSAPPPASAPAPEKQVIRPEEVGGVEGVVVAPLAADPAAATGSEH